MTSKVITIDNTIESILRGAAKILGCNSANLLAFDDHSRQVHIRVGIIEPKAAPISMFEGMLGEPLSGLSFPLELAETCPIYSSWRDQLVIEALSIGELIGGAFPAEVLAQIDTVIGEHRFISVPVLSPLRNYGVILFEKDNRHPFSPQQREVLIRYAKRIGDILDHDHGYPGTVSGSSVTRGRTPLHSVLLSAHGEFVGSSPSTEGSQATLPNAGLPAGLLTAIGQAARELLAEAGEQATPRLITWPQASSPAGHPVQPYLEAQLQPFRALGQPCALATIYELSPGHEASVQAQLLHLALAGAAPTLMVDPDFRITSCNEAAESLFGISAEDLTHEDIGVLFMNADDIHAILNHQFLFLSNGFHEETALLRLTSDQPASGRITALLLADEANQVVGFLVFIRQQPQPTSGAENPGIDTLMRQERLATMGEMAAQLAHEIRNPLLAIGATLESLAADRGPRDPDTEMLGMMAREVSRLDMILRDYLSLAARHNTHVTAVDLTEVLADIGRLLQGTRQQSGKELRFEVPHGLAVLADYEGLKHVLFNLIINALEASQGGGEVVCRALAVSGNATIFIEDRGGGLAAPADDCFKPFFSTKKNGTGLGLTVCKKIIASHGGSIALANRPGGGCQVTIVVPQRVSHERSSHIGAGPC